MSANSNYRRLLLAAALAGPLLILALAVIAWPHVPDPVAIHWNYRGPPDGSLSKVGALLLPAVVLALVAPVAMAWPNGAAAPNGRAAPLALAAIVFVSTFTVGIQSLIVERNFDQATWADAPPLATGALAGVFVAALLLMAAAALIARRAWPQGTVAESNATGTLQLAPHERVFWSGTAHNRTLLGVAVAVAALGVWAAIAGRPLLAAVPLLSGATLALFCRLRVTVDERWLRVQLGHFQIPATRLPLERVQQAAHLTDIDPLAHGGWGYRGLLSLGVAAIVVRAGEGLRLTLTKSQVLTITVDDAGTAAELINGLIARRGQPAGER